jgi:hypothetical protein
MGDARWEAHAGFSDVVLELVHATRMGVVQTLVHALRVDVARGPDRDASSCEANMKAHAYSTDVASSRVHASHEGEAV